MRIELTPAIGGTAVLILSGELDVQVADDIREVGELALNEPAFDTLRIDFSGVSFIDSTVIGALVAIRNRADATGRALILANPAQQVRRVLGITGLDQIFQLDPAGSEAEDEDRALAT